MIYFWIGFILMFLNEGFVIMRHVHPWFAAKRESLIAYLGRYWKVTHSIADTLWIVLIAYGYYLVPDSWETFTIPLLTFWLSVLLFVYIPKWFKL